MDFNQLALKVGLAQIEPVWLNKGKTIDKILDVLNNAALKSCELIVFGEAVLPGYPFWLEFTNGAKFESKKQKELYSYYLQQSITINDLKPIRALAKKHGIAIYLGCVERAENRSGHSLYCSLIYIDQDGKIKSVHRKLQPTYEERLVWAQGDGNGLKVHPLKGFKLGGLNCWENWMPLWSCYLLSDSNLKTVYLRLNIL